MGGKRGRETSQGGREGKREKVWIYGNEGKGEIMERYGREMDITIEM